jgi:hypothetical protein
VASHIGLEQHAGTAIGPVCRSNTSREPTGGRQQQVGRRGGRADRRVGDDDAGEAEGARLASASSASRG